MYNEIIIARLYSCLEHIEAIERYFKGAQNTEQFFHLNEGVQYDNDNAFTGFGRKPQANFSKTFICNC